MKIRGLIISLSLLLLYALNACAQTDDKKIYIFHSKVGKVIEVEEWRLYRIFPYLVNFHSAKLFIDPDGNTTLELLREENGELKSTKQTVKKDEIARLRAIVNYLNPSEERSPLLILPKLEDNSQLFFGHKDFELFSPKPYALHELHRTGFPVQVLGGTIASAGLGWGLFYVIANTGRDAPTLGSFVVGGFLGSLTSIFAAPLGVRIASIGSHPHGSYWIGVVGSIVGTGATIGIGQYTDFETGLVILPVVQSAFAALGYNLSRKIKINSRGVIAGNIQDNEIEYSFLKFNIKHNPFNNSEIIPSVDFLRITF